MKKIIKLLIITVMLLPITVLADMGAPMIQPYYAYIKKEGGITAKCGSESVTIKKDEKVKVTYEYYNEAGIEYNGKSCIINIEDIKAVEEEYKPADHIDEIKKLDSPKKIKIVKTDGVDIYSGPSTVYNKIASIPKDKELKYSYSSGDDNGRKPIWLYVEYQEYRGWIKTGEGADGENYILFEFNNEIPIIHDIKLTKSDNTSITVPKDTKINSGYMMCETFNCWYNSYYVNYNNAYGHLDLDYRIIEETTTTLTKDTYLYDSKEIELDENGNLISMKGNKIDSIPANTTIKYNIIINDYTYGIAYVNYNGKKGWVKYYPEGEGENNQSSAPTTPEATTTTQEATTVATTSKVNNNKSISGKELIIICILGAVIISITAVVIVILLNKNKKSQKQDVNKIDEEKNDIVIDNNEQNQM